MRGRFSQRGARLVLGAMFANDAFSPPKSIWLALTTSPVNDASTGATLSELPLDSGYKRAAYELGSEWWTPTGLGTFANTKELEFNVSNYEWQRLTWWAMVTGQTSGDVIAFGPAQIPRIQTGSRLKVPVGVWQVSMRGSVQ